MARVLVFACVVLAACQTGSATRDIVRLSGVIRDIGVVQEEPQAEPQTSMMLDHVRGPGGQRTPVIVTGPGHMFCSKGNHVVVEGRYKPPDKLFETAFLDGARIVKCRP